MNEYTQNDALSPGYPGERRDFRLTVRSRTVSLSALASQDDGDSVSMPVTARRDDRPVAETENVEVTTTCAIDEKDGRLVLRYEDQIDPDESPVPTSISFDPGMPELVTLERGGFLSSVMIFEEGSYTRAKYKTPFAAFEMTVFSRRVENGLTPGGGKLVLDYSVEFKGAANQRVNVSLEASPL